MLLHYATAEKTTVARFLQLSLLKAVDASKAVTRRDAQAATACHSPCIREAQQVRRLPQACGRAGRYHEAREHHLQRP